MLASLSPIAYDQRRVEASAQLGIRVSTLDSEMGSRRPIKEQSAGNSSVMTFADPELYPEAVDGLVLMETVVGIFRRFLILPPGADVALTLFVFHTYLLDAAEASPIIALTSPEKRCGKTVVLEVLQSLTRRPLPAANITAAALFRTIEAFRPTLLIDEADSFLPDNEELRGVLNSGHRRGTASIIRTTGDNYEPKAFSTWCAKAIALIGKLPGTLEDRSIEIAMVRKARDEKVERLRHRVLIQATTDIRRKLARWADDNKELLIAADPEIPTELNDRAGDCWRPLLAIADAIGGDWPNLSRAAAITLSAANSVDDTSIGTQLLADLASIFSETEKLWSDVIVQQLAHTWAWGHVRYP